MPFVKVTRISDLVTKENLQELFQCCGDVNGLSLVLEEGKKVAYVEFSADHHVETAQMLNGTELGDAKLEIIKLKQEDARRMINKMSGKSDRKMSEYEHAVEQMQKMMKGPSDAQEQRNNEVKRTIYVGNLSKHCTPSHLREEFGQIGEVVYIKFSGNADFRYAFIEFATEQQTRMAFTFHGKVIAGQAIKIGTAHNPIFKDDAHDEDNPLWQAKQAARKASRRHHDERREQRERGSRSRDRGRRRRRRRRRRSRSRTRSHSEEQQKMFWDGYQWHFNDTKDEDIEEHVTSIIRSDVDAPPNEVDQNEKMQNEAMKALRALQQNKSFGF